jgi:hypothetical protein
MNKSENDWPPVAKMAYWIFVLVWTLGVFSFYSHPMGVLGNIANELTTRLTPKYVTLIVNTFSIVGAYAVTRLLLGFRVPFKSPAREAQAVLVVLWLALSMVALSGARCDIYLFCSEDVISNGSDCELESDRQGISCR